MNWPVLAFALALGISFLATPWVRRLALRMNVLVQPGGRRVHSQAMPLWGGIAIFGAFFIAILVITRLTSQYAAYRSAMIGVLVSSTLVVIIGLLDDMKEFSAAIQVIGIVFAGAILMAFGVKIQFLSNPFSKSGMIVLAPVISVIVTITWVFLVTKTVDFMDGLDGLAAGIGAIGAGILAIMAHYAVQPHVALMAATLCGACIGFLRFNFNPAKIFMGTGGSQFIGFVLAAIAIIGAFKVAAAMAIALPVLVFGVPIADGIFVIFKRFRDRRPLHVADRSHLHHRLLEKGLSHKQTVIVIYIMCLIVGGAALALFWVCMHKLAG
jgi:UDP-GlcNAc:undecaprenyl-phosphate/decaprenyl-phosphate GlcNAc-1-phosphate transferase